MKYASRRSTIRTPCESALDGPDVWSLGPANAPFGALKSHLVFAGRLILERNVARARRIARGGVVAGGLAPRRLPPSGWVIRAFAPKCQETHGDTGSREERDVLPSFPSRWPGDVAAVHAPPARPLNSKPRQRDVGHFGVRYHVGSAVIRGSGSAPPACRENAAQTPLFRAVRPGRALQVSHRLGYNHRRWRGFGKGVDRQGLRGNHRHANRLRHLPMNVDRILQAFNSRSVD